MCSSDLDGIILLDVGMREADGSAIMSHDVGNLVLAEGLALNLTKFEACFFGINTNRHEAALDVIEQTEVLASLDNVNDIHETKWVLVVSSGLSVHLDVSLLIIADLFYLLAGKSVL